MNNWSSYENLKGYKRRASGQSSAPEHTLMAERALGHKLPAGAVVHHVDENKFNNTPGNLVVCPNEAYHKLLHTRSAALTACGNADHRKCWVCGAYDNKDRLSNARGKSNKAGEGTWFHVSCNRKYMADYHQTVAKGKQNAA